ncbi:hypothetical protein ACPTKS_02820 [Pseudomonas aeruginosa]|uniref:hypothetical protein n=1 Tax=Pseudomonas aeruginosa TaxID=287 RepID=UPI003CC5AF38
MRKSAPNFAPRYSQTSETLLKQNDPAAAAALDELDKAIEALADTASATTHLSSTSLDSSEL